MDLIRNMLTRFVRPIWHLTLAGIVFGCGTATALAQQQFPMTPPGTLFVMGSYFGNSTQILDSHNRQIATIPEYGYEAVGSDGTVYIARSISGYSTNTLDLFAPPYKKRSATLTYGGFGMSGVATDPQHGMFAVTGDWITSPLGGPGFIRLYRDGTTKQCSYVPFPGGNVGGSSAFFDREGTFYTYAYQAPLLVSVAGGCNAKQFVLHRLPPGTIGSPIVFDNNDHLLLQNFGSNVVTIHAHPGYGPVGPTIATTTLQKIDGKVPNLVCLTSDGKHLWADTGSSIGEYLYPQGGAPLVVTRESAKYGLLAVFPPFPF